MESRLITFLLSCRYCAGPYDPRDHLISNLQLITVLSGILIKARPAHCLSPPSILTVAKMSTAPTLDFQSAPVNPRGMATSELAHKHNDDKKMMEEDINVYVSPSGQETGMEVMDPELVPTEEDLLTLRKIAAPLPYVLIFEECDHLADFFSWPGVAMCLIEFAERASYYGCKGPFNNFVNRPLPVGGNGAGAVAPGGESNFHFFTFFSNMLLIS